MDLPTLLLSVAAVIAGLAAIPHGPTRRPAYSACIGLALIAVVVFFSRGGGAGAGHAQSVGSVLSSSATTSTPVGTATFATPSPSPTPTMSDSATSDPTTSASSTSSSPTPTVSSSPTTTSFESAPPTPQKVSLAQLCDSGGDAYICGGRYGGSIQVGDRMFAFHGQDNGFADVQPPNWNLVLSFPANSCTQMVMSFAIDGSKDTSHLEVVQTSVPPVVATAGAGQIGTLTAKLDGGPFRLQANADKGSQVFVDGYAICTTANAQ